MTFDLPEEYRAIGVFYDALEQVLALPDDVLLTVNAEVSGWSPGQQLYHISRGNGMMLKGIALICQGHRSAANEGEPNAAGHRLLSTGHFPRGVAQAPKAVVPPEAPSREELETSLTRSRKRYAETEALLSAMPEATGRLQHRFLGMLNAAEWLRLIRIHSEHHLTIIREIIGQEEAT